MAWAVAVVSTDNPISDFVHTLSVAQNSILPHFVPQTLAPPEFAISFENKKGTFFPSFPYTHSCKSLTTALQKYRWDFCFASMDSIHQGC